MQGLVLVYLIAKEKYFYCLIPQYEAVNRFGFKCEQDVSYKNYKHAIGVRKY